MSIKKNINKNEDDSNRYTLLHNGLNDGNISVTFTENDLEVFADFIPPLLYGRPLNIQDITDILEKINVVYGVNWDIIKQALDECNTSHRQINNILIAQGEMPEVEISEYFELNPQLEKKKREVDSKARINHREFSPFTIVKKGQIIATLKPKKEGREGINVRGVPLPFTTLHPEGVIGKTNTLTEGNHIIAEIHGQLIISRNDLIIQEDLFIKGAVGYATGNIAFPGNVTIAGSVSDGFKIHCGGTLVIKQTLDLTEVVTKGDINVSGGIIGKGIALIKSGGSIKTKFIENCRVAARRSVLVDSGIINSNVFAINTVELGEKGKIIGGEIYSIRGLNAGSIGKKAGKKTYIHCGIDFAAQQEIENYNHRLGILSAKLAMVQEMLADPVPEKEIHAKMEALFLKLENEKQTIIKRISELMGKVNVDENATVEVLGVIAAGTEIEICQVSLLVEEPLNKVRISLNKAEGKLEVQSL